MHRSQRSATLVDTRRPYATPFRCRRHGIAELEARGAALVTTNSRELLDDAVDAMLNNETCFYRECSVFDDIAATALERVREINKLRRRLTIWHCGVSTGQEA